MESGAFSESVQDADSWLHGLAPSIAAFYKLTSPASSCSDGNSLERPVRLKAIDIRRDLPVHLDVLPKLHPIVIAYRREYAALSALNLPGIIRACDYFENESCAVLATEWISGETLAERLRREGLYAGYAIQVLTDLAEILSEANRRQVHHLDLRPERIVLRRQISPLLAVRGFEFVPDAWGCPGDDAQEYLSHLLYAPQQRGTENWEAYSWGVIAFELLSGVRPFESGDPFAAAMMHRAVAAPALSAICDVPKWLSDLVSSCLHKRPQLRLPIGSVARCMELQQSPSQPEQTLPLRADRDFSLYRELIARLREENAARLGIALQPDENSCVVPLFGAE